MEKMCHLQIEDWSLFFFYMITDSILARPWPTLLHPEMEDDSEGSQGYPTTMEQMINMLEDMGT